MIGVQSFGTHWPVRRADERGRWRGAQAIAIGWCNCASIDGQRVEESVVKKSNREDAKSAKPINFLRVLRVFAVQI